jgi:AsmA protein
MKGILKVVAIVAGALLVIVVAVLVAVGYLFNPNDYKAEIAAAVAKATGRTLTLDGNLALSTFPTIRIQVGSATLSNAPGFGSTPMAKIGGAELRVSLWPLLFGNVEIGEARLSGLELNLARDARGRNNWQDLGGGAGAPAGGAAPSSGGGAANLNLGVDSLQIDDARVTWNDASTGSKWELTGFGLNAKGFGVGKKFPLDVRFALAGADVAVKVAANMEATITLASDEYRLDRLVTKISGSGRGWPGGQGDATLKIDSLDANLGKETVDLNGLSLTVLGITTTGSLKGTKLMSSLSLTGAVDIQQFDPQDVLGVLKVKVETADSKVLRSASAKANFLYNSKQTGLSDMQLKLDESTLTGRVGLDGEKLTYALAVDDINVDRYLPPGPPSGKTDAPKNEGSLDAVDLPLDVLRTLNADGTLKFGKAKFSGLTVSDAAFALTAANGMLKLTPTASLYGGKYGGDINVTVEKTDAKMTIAQHVDAVDLDPLGKDLLGAQYFTGVGNVKLDLVATGSNLGAMRKGVDGAVSFDVKNGSLEGVDLWYELRRVRAVLDKSEAPARPPGPRRTSFSALSATGDVKDALLTNKDLKGVLDFMNITGSGTVNLLDDKIDLDLKATMVDGPKLQSDPLMAKYAGQSLPLHATGTMAEPSVLPDVGALAKQRASDEANKALDEQKQKAQDKLKDKLKGLLNR